MELAEKNLQREELRLQRNSKEPNFLKDLRE